MLLFGSWNATGNRSLFDCCLESVLLWGARASGKTTRLPWLRNRLELMRYQALYFSLESINYESNVSVFGELTRRRNSTSRFPTFPAPFHRISSQADFLECFWASAGEQRTTFPSGRCTEKLPTVEHIRNRFQICITNGRKYIE